MSDPNIPVAIATEVVTGNDPYLYNATGGSAVSSSTTPPPPRGLDSKKTGRSSRVVVTEEREQHALGEYEIHALKAQGYTQGLAEAMKSNVQTFPLRIWVVDNSGSMAMNDGCRMAQTKNKSVVKLVACTRWTEIQETVDYHAQMAALLQAPTVFRLLNDPGKFIGPQQFSIAENTNTIPQDLQLAQETMKKASPSGVTPLADHIREIRSNVIDLQAQLLSQGQKIAIILATDGLPTDSMGQCNSITRQDFEQALRSLEGLPVWIVVRLCTNEDHVVHYYNSLDAQLELSLEVLDDFISEAQEVYQANPWLNYSLCLHRIREMGFHHRLFDLLDERPFTIDELSEFLLLLLGSSNQLISNGGIPDPHVDWKTFYDQTYMAVSQEDKQWNPNTKKMAPWIDMHKVHQMYGPSSCVIS